MPTYEYACRECGNHLEVVQSFTDDPLETCERCGGPLRKVFSAAGIIFKGSGYYVTDTRAAKGKMAASTSSNGDSASSDGDAGGSDSSSDTSKSSDSKSSDSKSSSSKSSSSKSSSADSASDAKTA